MRSRSAPTSSFADSRLDDSLDNALAHARTNLVLAGTILSGPGDVTDAVESYAQRSDFETVALAGGEAFSTSFSFGTVQIPAGVQRIVRDGDLAYERVPIAGTSYLVAGGQVPPSQTELYFFFSEEALHDDLAQLRTILLVGWVVVVVLSAAAGALVARRVLRPVAQASEAAHSLAEGLLETRLPVDADDEFGAWATSFNEMAEALEEKIRALSEAQARERRFTSDVAHELRTPLTALAGEASLLGEHLDRMPEEAQRPAQMLVDGRRTAAPPGRGADGDLPSRRRPGGRAHGAGRPGLARSRPPAVARMGDERVPRANDVVVETDPRRVERILSNLIENALAHGGRDAAVHIGRNGTDALVEVSDLGPGIAPEHLPHVFERFYKADSARAGGGSGLGLAIALENARLLGGGIDASSEVGAGSRFTLRLPVAKPLRAGADADERESDDERR